MILDDLADRIASTTTMTVGVTLGKAVMRDDEPDTVAVLYETGGAASEYAYSTSTGSAQVVYESPNIQCLSRSTDYQTARNAAETVYTALDGLAGVTLNGVKYLSIGAVQPPFSIGRDEKERYLVSVNFRVKKLVS